MDDPIKRPAILGRIDAFCERWPDAEYGPAHLVLSDYNLSDYHIGYCLGCCDHYTGEWGDHNLDEIAATRAFLTELLLDEDGRDTYMDGDDEPTPPAEGIGACPRCGEPLFCPCMGAQT